MFVEDLKNDFYNVLLGNRVLLLVHYDVDAICTCKILQGMFKCDNISYTLVPVGGVSDLKRAYEENNEEIKYVVLVNCGGTIDLVDILQPESDVIFFVLDSHKPTDICNVYSDGQVRIIHRDSEENIPNFEDIFRDDDEEDEQVESGLEALEAVVERRRERRAWEEQRHTLMFNYTQFSYYGKPSACVALEAAWQCSREAPGAMWAAGVALAAHEALARRAPAQCLLDADPLYRRLAAAPRRPDATYGQVVVQKDAWLPLYRSWSVEAALRHAPSLAPRLRLHAAAGDTTVRRLLADMGFPLQQARQSYRAMDVELRRGLLEALEAAGPRHNLPAVTRAAFLLARPLAPPLPALDLAVAALALLEHETLDRAEGFQKALWALETEGSNGEGCRQEGMEAAKAALQAVARLVHGVLAARQLLLAGPFCYFIVPEGSPEARFVRGPLWLSLAARWAAAAAPGARPLLAAAPHPSPDSASQPRCLLLGVPPRNADPRNLFGAAFEQAANKSGVSVSLDYFDSSVVILPTEQRARFLDALTALLA